MAFPRLRTSSPRALCPSPLQEYTPLGSSITPLPCPRFYSDFIPPQVYGHASIKFFFLFETPLPLLLLLFPQGFLPRGIYTSSIFFDRSSEFSFICRLLFQDLQGSSSSLPPFGYDTPFPPPSSPFQTHYRLEPSISLLSPSRGF